MPVARKNGTHNVERCDAEAELPVAAVPRREAGPASIAVARTSHGQHGYLIIESVQERSIGLGRSEDSLLHRP